MYKTVGIRSLVSPRTENAEKLKSIADAARVNNHTAWLDGTPVTTALMELGEGVRKMVPSVKFYGSVVSCDHQYITNLYEVFTEVHVVVGDSPLSTARIGHGGYRGNKGDMHYMVDARGIINDKYRTSRPQYSMKLASKLPVAIKNTVANLVPHSVAEIASITFGKYSAISTKAGEEKSSKLPALMGAVSDAVLLNEIRALQAQGVKFLTPEFQAIVDNMDEAIALANDERSKRVVATLVHFTKRGDRTIAKCVTVPDVRRSREVNLQSLTSEEFELDVVPAYIVEKVSVLQTLECGNHVDGVGMKVVDNVFWVEK